MKFQISGTIFSGGNNFPEKCYFLGKNVIFEEKFNKTKKFEEISIKIEKNW